MCGRFTHRYTWRQLYRLLGLTMSADPVAEFGASYNVAPTQMVPIVRQDAAGNRTVAPARWGLVPSWADDPKIGSRLINARSEEAAVKPSFRAAMRKRRCLVPADGFYEWRKIEGGKRPWYFTVRDVPVFGFAGLWESWDRDGSRLETFTILTSKPNPLVAPIHDRMPVIVRPEFYGLWLDPATEDPAKLALALEPFPADQMEAYPVSTRVNSPSIDDASLIERLK